MMPFPWCLRCKKDLSKGVEGAWLSLLGQSTSICLDCWKEQAHELQSQVTGVFRRVPPQVQRRGSSSEHPANSMPV